MSAIIGIDPDKKGAIAIIEFNLLASPAKEGGELVMPPTLLTRSIPTLKISKTKMDYDIQEIRKFVGGLCRKHDNGQIFFAIEDTAFAGFTSKMAARSAARGGAIWEMLMAVFEIPYVTVNARTWQAAMFKGMPRGKGTSKINAKRKAEQLWPRHFEEVQESLQGASKTAKDKFQSHYDATCIAEYGRMIRGQLTAKNTGQL